MAGGIQEIMGKRCRREGKEETKREREGGTGKGNSALVVGDRRLCQWGPGQSPGRKKMSCILGFTKYFWLIDNLIFSNAVTTFVG